MSKYTKYILFFVFIGIIIFSGGRSTGKEEVVFRITWETRSGRGETIQKIVDMYNEESEEYYVSMVSGNEEKSNIIEELNNNTVDVYMMPYRYIKNSEVASELGTFVCDDKFDGFYPSMVELSKNGDDIKGMPWIGHSMSLIYNRDLCNEAGIDPKEWNSMEDLLSGCEAIVEHTNASGLGLMGADNHDTTWMVNQFIYSFGGELVELNSDNEFVKVSIDSKESYKALDFYKNQLGALAQNGWEDHDGSDVIQSFALEEIAFEIQGPWGITDIWKKGSLFEVGAIPLSQIGMYSEVGPIMLSVDKDMIEDEGVHEFIDYLNTSKALNVLLTGEYEPKYQAYFPFRVPIMNDSTMEFYELYPEFRSFSAGFEKPSISTPCVEWASDYDDKYQKVLHKIFAGDLTIEQGLKEVAQ